MACPTIYQYIMECLKICQYMPWDSQVYSHHHRTSLPSFVLCLLRQRLTGSSPQCTQSERASFNLQLCQMQVRNSYQLNGVLA